MMQQLTDLYEVEFNQVRTSTMGNVVVNDQNNEMVIVLGNDTTIIVGEPYLLPLSKYGNGFKRKTLIRKNCCWLGSTIASKVGNATNNVNASLPYRMVETTQ